MSNARKEVWKAGIKWEAAHETFSVGKPLLGRTAVLQRRCDLSERLLVKSSTKRRNLQAARLSWATSQPWSKHLATSSSVIQHFGKKTTAFWKRDALRAAKERTRIAWEGLWRSFLQDKRWLLVTFRTKGCACSEMLRVQSLLSWRTSPPKSSFIKLHPAKERRTACTHWQNSASQHEKQQVHHYSYCSTYEDTFTEVHTELKDTTTQSPRTLFVCHRINLFVAHLRKNKTMGKMWYEQKSCQQRCLKWPHIPTLLGSECTKCSGVWESFIGGKSRNNEGNKEWKQCSWESNPLFLKGQKSGSRQSNPQKTLNCNKI